MQEDIYSAESLPPSASRGLGCAAKGFLAVVLLLILVGGLGWYAMWNFAPFLSQQPVPVRIFPATDAQYQAVADKIAPFVQAVNGGRAALLALTADDLNILISRDPLYATMRGKIYFTIINNSLCAETTVLANEDTPESQKLYFHGRVVFDASFVSGEFALAVRSVEPSDGGSTPSLVAWFVQQESFSRGISHAVNIAFHDTLSSNPTASALFDRVRTIIVKGNQIVVTAQDSRGPVATPAILR